MLRVVYNATRGLWAVIGHFPYHWLYQGNRRDAEDYAARMNAAWRKRIGEGEEFSDG